VERELRDGTLSQRPPTEREAAELTEAIRCGRSQDFGLARLAPLDLNSPCVDTKEGGKITLLEYACAGAGDGRGWLAKPQVVSGLLRAGARPSFSHPASVQSLRHVYYRETRLHIVVESNKMRRAGSTSPETGCCAACRADEAALRCRDCGETLHAPSPSPFHVATRRLIKLVTDDDAGERKAEGGGRRGHLLILPDRRMNWVRRWGYVRGVFLERRPRQCWSFALCR
jgi:hypothetical protein